MEHGLRPNRMGILYLSPLRDVGFGEVTLAVETGNRKLTAFEDCRKWEVLCWGGISARNIRRL
jgi:hypothetical protein